MRNDCRYATYCRGGHVNIGLCHQLRNIFRFYASSILKTHTVSHNLSIPEKADIVICAPFTQLDVLADALAGSAVGVGAQNFYPAAEGAFTGEVSLPMLQELGVRYWVSAKQLPHSVFICLVILQYLAIFSLPKIPEKRRRQ